MPLAVICRTPGDPDGARLDEVPSAPLAAGQVRVAVRAVGVNFVDVLMLAGRYQYKPPPPFVPGLEAAGEVVEAGDGAAYRPGDRVMARVRNGAYADELVVPSAALTPTPPGFGDVEAAALQVAFATAYSALVERARLRPGEMLLVLGAGGGVGLAAVEVGRLLGATVVAVASSEAKLAAARSRGAAHGVAAQGGGFRDAVRGIAPGGVDAVFDPVGGAAFEESLRCLAYGARVLVVGFTSGIGLARANLVLIKGASVLGVRAGEAERRDPALGDRMRAAMRDWAAQGHLRPHVSRVLPLARWAEALRLLADRQAVGRVVLVTG